MALEWEVALLLEKWVEEVGSGDGRIGWVMCLLLTAQLDEVLQAEEEGSNVCPTPPQKAVQLIFDFSVIVTYYLFLYLKFYLLCHYYFVYTTLGCDDPILKINNSIPIFQIPDVIRSYWSFFPLSNNNFFFTDIYTSIDTHAL